MCGQWLTYFLIDLFLLVNNLASKQAHSYIVVDLADPSHYGTAQVQCRICV